MPRWKDAERKECKASKNLVMRLPLVPCQPDVAVRVYRGKWERQKRKTTIQGSARGRHRRVVSNI